MYDIYIYDIYIYDIYHPIFSAPVFRTVFLGSLATWIPRMSCGSCARNPSARGGEKNVDIQLLSG